MEQQRSTAGTRLQADLVPRLIELIRGGGWQPGTHLTEQGLARTLRVSRTPVRAALRHLASHGVATIRASGGFVLADTSPVPVAAALSSLAPDEGSRQEQLSIAIVHDRLAGALPDVISEAELMRRYGIARRPLQAVLRQLEAVALVERRLGHGWAFLEAITDGAARDESYRWRMIIEPAALLEPGYALAPDWIASMRQRHGAVLRAPVSSLAFFEMNAEFHAGLAAGAGNRFLHAAVEQQNQLRRARNYDWVYGTTRVRTNCVEHLELLDRIEASEQDVAATLLRRHLSRAAAIRRGEADVTG